MAFYDEEEGEGGQDPSAMGGVQKGALTASIAPGAGGAGNQPQPPGSPDKSGNFVGISQYLNANKAQAGKLGDQAASVIDSSANEARGAIGQFDQEAQQIKGVDALGNDIKSKIGTAAETLSDDERKLVKNTASAQYQGPKAATELKNFQTAQKAADLANQNVQKADTEEGRMGLVTQINAKPRTQGMNVFDNVLIQAGSGREKLAQAAQRNQDVVGKFDQAKEGAAQRIGRLDDPSTPDIDESAGAMGQTAKAQKDAFSTVQNSLNSWKEQFSPKVKNAQDQLVANQQRIVDDLGDDPYSLDGETLALLGLRPGDRLFDTDLNAFMTQASPGDINAANIASAEDYARYGALADLAGDQSNFLNPNNAALAGTAPTSVYDSAGLRKALEDKMNRFQNTARNTNLSKQFDEAFYMPGGGIQGQQGTVSANLSDWMNNQQINNSLDPAYNAYQSTTGTNAQTQRAQLEQMLQAELDRLGYNTQVNAAQANKQRTPTKRGGI